MNYIRNKQEISMIEFTMKAHCFCSIGNDWYTNNFRVTFVPGEMIPDYIDIHEMVQTGIEGERLSVEEATAYMYDLMAKYEPENLIVSSLADDAETHFPVRVTKSMFDLNPHTKNKGDDL